MRPHSPKMNESRDMFLIASQFVSSLSWHGGDKKLFLPLVFIAFTVHITAMMMPAPQQQLLSMMDPWATVPSGLSHSWQASSATTAPTIHHIGGNKRAKVGRHMHLLIRVLHLFGSNPKFFSRCQGYWLLCALHFLCNCKPSVGRDFYLWLQWHLYGLSLRIVLATNKNGKMVICDDLFHPPVLIFTIT